MPGKEKHLNCRKQQTDAIQLGNSLQFLGSVTHCKFLTLHTSSLKVVNLVTLNGLQVLNSERKVSVQELVASARLMLMILV